MSGIPIARMRRTHENLWYAVLFNLEGKPVDSDGQPDKKRANEVVFAPSRSSPKNVDWDVFHASVGHVRESPLQASAKSMNFELTGHLHPCEGCLAAKCIRKPILKQTATRSSKKLGRDRSRWGSGNGGSWGSDILLSFGTTTLARYMWRYFLANKSDTPRAL